MRKIQLRNIDKNTIFIQSWTPVQSRAYEDVISQTGTIDIILIFGSVLDSSCVEKNQTSH